MVTARAPNVDDEIPGQVTGFWIAPWDEVPRARPAHRPTGALLPRDGEALTDGAVCLDLVPVHREWRPLSEAGRLTYSHTSGLLRNERWRFVVWGHGAFRVFDTEFAPSLAQEKVAVTYSDTAAMRARDDRPAVQLRLRLTR